MYRLTMHSTIKHKYQRKKITAEQSQHILISIMKEAGKNLLSRTFGLEKLHT